MRNRPPLLLIAGAGLLILAMLQLGHVAVLLEGRGVSAGSGAGDNPKITEMFSELPQAKLPEGISVEPPAPKVVAEEPGVVHTLPRQPHNPVLGNVRGATEVVVFTASCSPELARFTTSLQRRPEVSTVIKFYPPSRDALDSGILMQLAQRQGYFEAYWQELCTRAAQDLPAQVAALEAAGMSLAKQRAAMAMHLSAILPELNADIALAETVGVMPSGLPVYFVNGVKTAPADVVPRVQAAATKLN